jgi:transcriptional regulator NrdR family protein
MTKSEREEILARTVKMGKQNRRCTMPFGTKEFMKLMNLAIYKKNLKSSPFRKNFRY